ncbi:MAG: histidinol-phosphate transaminase [Deltaproteobacteria bacterium]|nr:histidinol-phosphate transaminase [Deltaproteobacteria bacterium]
MSKYWSPTARSIEPYTPGEQPRDRRYIKLNTNESPYPPAPAVLEAIGRAADESLRLYPDPECEDFRTTVGRYFGLQGDQVFPGNGSDELLAFAYFAFFDPDAAEPILFPDITYSFFPVYASLFRIPFERVPLREDFSIPLEPFCRPNGGIVLANPNAPTGMCLSIDAVRSILEGNGNRVVIVDEAYIDFGGDTAAGLVPEFPNLLVIHTLSKSRSLAGLRVAYALGQAELIEGINRIKNSINSYTLDRLALAGATAAMKEESYYREMRGKITATRERVTGALVDMGFTVVPSRANFIFTSHPTEPAGSLFSSLRELGILVRYFNLPRIDNHLRVTIGTDAEMDAFLAALKRLV